MRRSYKSNEKISWLFLINLISRSDPISETPPEYANAPVIVLKGLMRYVPGVFTAPTIVIFLALKFCIDISMFTPM